MLHPLFPVLGDLGYTHAAALLRPYPELHVNLSHNDSFPLHCTDSVLNLAVLIASSATLSYNYRLAQCSLGASCLSALFL